MMRGQQDGLFLFGSPPMYTRIFFSCQLNSAAAAAYGIRSAYVRLGANGDSILTFPAL